MRVRDTVTIHVSGDIPSYRCRREPRRNVRGLHETRINAEVLAAALRLAGGDRARLVLHHTGAVTVANSREHRDAILRRRNRG